MAFRNLFLCNLSIRNHFLVPNGSISRDATKLWFWQPETWPKEGKKADKGSGGFQQLCREIKLSLQHEQNEGIRDKTEQIVPEVCSGMT